MKLAIFQRNGLAITPFLITALLSATLPFGAAIVNPCGFVAEATRTLGSDGANGQVGRAGRAGESGRNRTIRAGNGPVEVNLPGQDGRQGRDGADATRARCNSRHDEPDEDLQGADGGDGGRGGQGGQGGNGGMLTVYYQNLTQLREISVYSPGGQGGEGGRGGRGTHGCDCYKHEWSVTECSDGSCETEDYTCENGEDGRDGRIGADGEPGEMGIARLVKQTDELLPENPKALQVIATFPSAPIALSRNLWETKTGGPYLFASGSVIGDRYQEYTGRVEQQIQLLWEANRPTSDFSGNLNLAINEQGELQINPEEDLWLDSTLSTEGNLTTYRINGAIEASEATRLSLGRNRGSGDQLTFNVVDLAGTSDLVETRFYLRYRTNDSDRRPRYVTRYEAEIPSELVTQEYNNFSVAVGQLPIRSQYLRGGTEARLELVVTRSYGGNSAEQTLDWSGRL